MVEFFRKSKAWPLHVVTKRSLNTTLLHFPLMKVNTHVNEANLVICDHYLMPSFIRENAQLKVAVHEFDMKLPIASK